MFGGSVQQFLALNVESIQEGEKYCYKFSQPGLFKNILKVTDMMKYNGMTTPTVNDFPLGLVLGSKPAETYFEYPRLEWVEDLNHPNCSRSCTGFIIAIAGCLVVWKRKLQTDILLSTLPASCKLGQICPKQ
eukprot:8636383-Ditylum_brightwellii.AAC.1